MTKRLPNYYPDPLEFYRILGNLTPEELTEEWQPVSEKRYNDMLNILPPIRFSGHAFMVGECMTHTENGAIYDAFIKMNDGTYWNRPAYLHTWNPPGYMEEIQALHT